MQQQGLTLRQPRKMGFWAALDQADQGQASVPLDPDSDAHEEDLRSQIQQKYDSELAGFKTIASSGVMKRSDQVPHPEPSGAANGPLLANSPAHAPPSMPMLDIARRVHTPIGQSVCSGPPGVAFDAESESEQLVSNAVSPVVPISEPLVERLRRKKQSTVVIDRFEGFQATRKKQLEKQLKDREKLNTGPRRQMAARGRPRVLSSGLFEGLSICIPPAYPHQRKHEDWWSIVSTMLLQS